MIVLDLSQVMISNIFMQIKQDQNTEINENAIRHMVLNSLRKYNTKFKSKYGKMIIACDSSNYWRKQHFPYYKANRKKSMAESKYDWKLIYEYLSIIKSEIKEYLPFITIEVESAEADDIIATMIFNSSDDTKLIISGDKDFIQLHSVDNVEQYSPVDKKFIVHDNPRRYLIEHIIKGDRNDGIPNALSPDNCFVIGQRQKPLTAKRLDAMINLEIEPEYSRYLERNRALIDLESIPHQISSLIMDEYFSQQTKMKKNMMTYFINKKLTNLIDHMQEFY